MVSGISLANKCQMLFGFAVVLILAMALSVPWIRTKAVVRDYQVEVARQLADAWIAERISRGSLAPPADLPAADGAEETVEEDEAPPLPVTNMTLIEADRFDAAAGEDPFVARALERFREDPTRRELDAEGRISGQAVYRYARAIRASEISGIEVAPDPPPGGAASEGQAETPGDRLRALLVIDRASRFADGQLLTSRVFIIAAGIVAGLLAVLVFYLILTKLIFSPARRLRETADKVQAGDLTIRSRIQTGDEFEQLSSAFDAMLDRVEQSQAQLRGLNESLDLKVSELSEANIGLFESNRLKSEFLANVSHELKTPLNSIIGFTELLDEIAQADGEADPKRLRYLGNILTSARSLLEMINELLDMAKIEAGRMEVNVQPTSIGDLVEGLVGIMRPQAEIKRITLSMSIGQYVPMLETDPGKLQQILYNFISNAIKYTPEGGSVTVTADRVTRQDNTLGVRLSVADTGPGIPADMQDVIFEKFRQLDASHTRQHAGTGLGLAICRELAEMLGAAVSFVSDPGRGATFFVDLPLTLQPEQPQPLMA